MAHSVTPSEDHRTLRVVTTGLVAAAMFCADGCQWKGKKEATHRETTRLVDQAHDAAQQGDVGRAEQLLAAAVEADPTDCEIRLQLSELLQEHGSLPGAIAHLEEAIDQSPDDPRAHVLLSQILFEQKQYDAADAHAKRALEIDPHLVQAHLLHGQIEGQRGDGESATASFFEALSIDPHESKSRFLAARQLYMNGSGDQAAPMLRRLIEESPICGEHAGETWWLLGRCYADQGRWRDAAQAMASGIELREASGTDWRELALVQYRAGEMQAARSSLALALKLAPGDPDSQSLRKAIEKAASPPIRLTEGDDRPPNSIPHADD